MTTYLLSVHSVEGEAGAPMTEEEMRQFMDRRSLLPGFDARARVVRGCRGSAADSASRDHAALDE